MTIDLEGDLRREFDAATPPSGLALHPESVLRQGSRTIRRRRIAAGGSAAMAVALVATGVGLLNGTNDSAAPQPAAPTATSRVVRAQAGYLWGGQSEIQFNRDPKVTSNVSYSVVFNGRRHELGTSSTGRPGQKPEAAWKSGMVEGHPVTIGVFPSGADLPTITFADGGSYGVGGEVLPGTGYSMFYIGYDMDTKGKEPARPSELASIRWTGPTGIVDGIQGEHRLTGRRLTIGEGVSVEVVLRPGDREVTTVSGDAHLTDAKGGYATPLADATIDASGVAVVTGRYPTDKRVNINGVKTRVVGDGGAPIAAGILPAGASNIGVELTSYEMITGPAVTERLPDGRVIFAIEADLTGSGGVGPGESPRDPSKDSIKAVTWTNADGTSGRKVVKQFDR